MEAALDNAGQAWLLLDVAIAMLLGSVLGIERELADKPAGLRTHMLVAAASALFVGLATTLVVQFGSVVGAETLRADPIRVLEAVVTGISFLAAGTIIRRDNLDVEGLTTAASILLAAAVGIAVALHLWLLSVGVVIFALLILRGFRFLEGILLGRKRRAGD